MYTIEHWDEGVSWTGRQWATAVGIQRTHTGRIRPCAPHRQVARLGYVGPVIVFLAVPVDTRNILIDRKTILGDFTLLP